MDEIEINGETYVKKSAQKKLAGTKDGMKYCIVRTHSAGVFAGYLESRTGQKVVMREARRIFYWDGAASLSQLVMSGTSKPQNCKWDGAASLSQLVMSGTSKPQNCKFPEVVDRVELLQAIEILDVTEAAQKSIDYVGVWKV